jgi:hypothetical protein
MFSLHRSSGFLKLLFESSVQCTGDHNKNSSVLRRGLCPLCLFATRAVRCRLNVLIAPGSMKKARVNARSVSKAGADEDEAAEAPAGLESTRSQKKATSTSSPTEDGKKKRVSKAKSAAVDDDLDADEGAKPKRGVKRGTRKDGEEEDHEHDEDDDDEEVVPKGRKRASTTTLVRRGSSAREQELIESDKWQIASGMSVLLRALSLQLTVLKKEYATVVVFCVGCSMLSHTFSQGTQAKLVDR